MYKLQRRSCELRSSSHDLRLHIVPARNGHSSVNKSPAVRRAALPAPLPEANFTTREGLESCARSSIGS